MKLSGLEKNHLLFNPWLYFHHVTKNPGPKLPKSPKGIANHLVNENASHWRVCCSVPLPHCCPHLWKAPDENSIGNMCDGTVMEPTHWGFYKNNLRNHHLVHETDGFMGILGMARYFYSSHSQMCQGRSTPYIQDGHPTFNRKSWWVNRFIFASLTTGNTWGFKHIC